MQPEPVGDAADAVRAVADAAAVEWVADSRALAEGLPLRPATRPSGTCAPSIFTPARWFGKWTRSSLRPTMAESSPRREACYFTANPLVPLQRWMPRPEVRSGILKPASL